MKNYLLGNYRLVSTVLLAIVLTLTFYVGLLSGKQEGGEGVVLSCEGDVLASLKIPLEKPAKDSEGLAASVTPLADVSKGKYVGSKNGTKYYRPECTSVKRIKPENYRWFRSAEDATLQGYSQGSC
jgi:hypothetical protein